MTAIPAGMAGFRLNLVRSSVGAAVLALAGLSSPAHSSLLPSWAATAACAFQSPVQQDETATSRLAAIVSTQSRGRSPCLLSGAGDNAFAGTLRGLPREIARPSAYAGRPNLFGSIALPAGRTPLDAKWHGALRSQLSHRRGPWTALLASVHGLDRRAQAGTINRWVNARVAYADDGKADRWSTAGATLAKRRGDCEDVAIAKMKLLEAAGVPRRDLYLVIAYDLVRRADHAVLALRDRHELVILDNMTDDVLNDARVPDYRPIVTLNAEGSWIHGFAQLASAR